MKRISLPLYHIIKSGKFVWTRVEAHAYGNLLYLMGLQIKNTIYNPTRTTCYMTDTGALETALLIFQWDPEKLDLNLIHTKSILLPTSIRRQGDVSTLRLQRKLCTCRKEANPLWSPL